MKYLKRFCRIAVAVLFWIGVWWFAAWRVGKPLLLPGPGKVLERLLALAATPEFYRITANSLWNILIGILFAIVCGVVLSLLTSHVRFLRELLLPLMSVIKATPVASFIVLALIFIGSSNVPTFTTVLIVLPLVWTNLDEGYRSIDPQLREMTVLYKFSPMRRFRLLTLPTLKPYFISSCRASMGMAWKAGVAAEIIAMPRNSIGTMIGDAKQYLLTEDMFAWTLLVILLSLLIEMLFSALFRLIGKRTEVKEVEAHA